VTAISIAEFLKLPGAVLYDVRRRPVFRAAADSIPGAAYRDPALVHRWMRDLPASGPVVVFCVHGHAVSQGAAAALRAAGHDARFLDGGIEAWRAAGKPTGPKPAMAPARWVTRERPKIDRVACPWLIKRFLDPSAEFHFVPSGDVMAAAMRLDAEPFDVPGVAFSHDGDLCSFDAFLLRYGLDDPGLRALAPIVRGADTGRPDLAPEAAGLLAMSLGLSAMNPADDHAMLRAGFTLYDALYAWASTARAEKHGWPPKQG
jgi:rhodanese-related sulfurtransferase